MDKAIMTAAWAFLIAGFVINTVFLLTSSNGTYPVWAIVPVLIGVALLTTYVSRRKRKLE